ncbi:MAG TPA: isoprenylcysteine carboxylmethyltransferase family protein [Vicinamibacteria bacterium]|nr:isoprenylcysteine carboxylmethyltransferase family protein [Vicinamibacteria bacterium]
MMALAVVLGGGSLAYFAVCLAWAEGPRLLDLHLSPPAALAWNALASAIFFAQHSVLVRRPVRSRLAAVIKARYDGAFYAITSGLALLPAAVLLQPAGPALFVLHGVARALVIASASLASAIFAWAIVVLRSFDPFGLRPIRRHLRDGDAPPAPPPDAASRFVVRGPYRWVRHPLYLAMIVLLWADPSMTPARLELALLWTAWIFVGARLEERDLAADLGDPYRSYRERVPMLIPWRRPAAR